MRTVLFLWGCTKPTVETPFEGPNGTTTLDTPSDEVLWIVTHLRVRNAPGPGRRFGEHASAVGEDLYEMPRVGWLGASFRNIGQLDWWTMTAWESEEALLDWVVSEPHASAMYAFTDVAISGENRWFRRRTDEGVLDWTGALEALEATPDFEYTQ